MLTAVRRAAAVVSLAVAATCAAVAVTAVPAVADRVCVEEGYVDGQISCIRYSDSGTPGTETGGGEETGPAAPPTCDLESAGQREFYADKNPSAPYCSGKNICFDVDHYAPLEMPAGPKPEEDSKARVTLCGPVIGPPVPTRIFWSGQEEPPTLLEQAETAVADLDFTTPAVGVSPATRTLVNLDTWFWLDGAQTTVTAQAFTLTATATLSTMTVDPGDGSGTFRCDNVATTAAEAEKSCVHEYRKASLRGGETVSGRPAFKATVTTVYDLVFTNGGGPIAIAGAPTTINGAPATTAVRVDEVQTVTRPNR